MDNKIQISENESKEPIKIDENINEIKQEEIKTIDINTLNELNTINEESKVNEIKERKNCQSNEEKIKKENEDNQNKNFEESVIQFIKQIQEKSNNSSDSSSVKFFNENIPSVLFQFLTLNNINCTNEIIKLIFYLFTNYLKIRINYIESMPANELNIIFKLFEMNFSYYNINNQLFPNEYYDNYLKDIFYFEGIKENKILNQEFLLRVGPNVNIYFKYLLTYLLHINFFQNFQKFISNPLIEFDKFYLIFSNVMRITNYYDFFPKEMILSLIKACVDYFNNLFVQNLVKEQNKIHLETFFNMSFYLDYLCLTHIIDDYYVIFVSQSEQESIKIINDFISKDMNCIYFLLLSNNLEKKVLGMKGLQSIINGITFIEKIDEKTNNNMHIDQINIVKKLCFAKKKMFIDWMEKINIFQIFFGENIHEAILKKASPCLTFLYLNQKLSFEQIDYIWKIAGEKHEAISDSILCVLSDLISSFSVEEAMHILKVINDIQFKEINDVTIKILDSFSNNKNLGTKDKNLNVQENNVNINFNQDLLQQTNNNFDFFDFNVKNENLKEIKNFKAFYLKILWKFSSENSFYSGLSSQIIIKSRKVLANILLKPVFKHELAKYVKKCIQGIGYSHLISTHLTILDLIIKNLKQQPSDTIKEILSASFGTLATNIGIEITDIKSFLNFLEKQYSLTSTVLHSIIDIKKEVMIIASEIVNLQNSIMKDNNNDLVNVCNSYNINEVLNNYESKFIENKFNKNNNIIEESKENNNKYSNKQNNIIDEEIEEINEILNKNQETNNNLLIDDLRANLNPNLDETLSTEKSLDNTISTISTEISSLEKSRIFIVKEFLENHFCENKPINLTNIKITQEDLKELHENYEIIFKKLKLNFTNANYYTIISSLLEFLKYIIFSSNIQLTSQQIEYLFTLLVENSVDEEEMNICYAFFAELFRYQQITKQNFVSEENLKFILFDLLLKIELSSLPFSGYNLFKQIFYYVNSANNNITLLSKKIIDIKDFSHVIAFETLWRFYLQNKNANIASDSQNILVNIISIIVKKEESKESFFYIFDKIFSNLADNYKLLKDYNNDIRQNNLVNICIVNKENFDEYEEMTKRLINLLFIVNSTRQKLEKKEELITINVQYNLTFSDTKKTPFILNVDTTIEILKKLIINKLIEIDPSNIKANINESNILILCKGRMLKNDKLTLKDEKITNGTLIIVSKTEYVIPDEPEIDERTLKEQISNLKSMFYALDDELLKRALKKTSYNIEDAVMYLLDDNNINTLKNEINEDNIIPINDLQSKLNVELFNDTNISLLINLLDLNLKDLNVYIWQLFSAIKFPNNIISMLIEPHLINFKEMFEIEKSNKLLLFLRILNCLIFNDKYLSIGAMVKLEENKKNEWKMHLMITDGLDILITNTSLIINNLPTIDELGYDCQIAIYISCLQIIFDWFHYFTFSAAISISPNKENLSNMIKQIISKRPQNINFAYKNISSSDINTSKTSSQPTPTFGSPHNSFEKDNKLSNDKKENVQSQKKAKLFSIIGAEEYDFNYEEEIANNFFVKLISMNFHECCITKFIKFASQEKIINNFSNLNEIIYFNILEILMILNDLNSEALKDFINLENDSLLFINLLFLEKSKLVRKTIENLFIILTQSKSINENIQSIKGLKLPIKSIKEFLITNILKNYKRIYTGQVYEEFFNLFGYMLLHEGIGSSLNDDLNIGTLSSHIVTHIYKLSSKSDLDLTEIEQEQLSGNIYLFQCLCANNDQIILDVLSSFNDEYNINFVNYLYNNLFALPDDQSDNIFDFENKRFKYFTKHLRQKTYNLLTSLIKINETFKIDLSNNLIKHHVTFSNETVNNMDLDISIRPKNAKLIGLRNYGATCYLNALLQQLFMIKAFRDNIFSMPVYEHQDLFIFTPYSTLDKNPLYQLQIVFANLMHSNKSYHTPINFINSFEHAFNNEPISCRQQQDALEFLDIVIDRLEQLSKVIGKDNFLFNTIRGKLTYDSFSLDQEYPFYSENTCDFHIIALDIKNKRNIEDAFEYCIKPETIEGFYSEKYDKKITIVRRMSIKQLPPHVIIQLKRFDFDYTTFERVKLNDYCEFPLQLDLKPLIRAHIYNQNKDDNIYNNVIITEEERNELNNLEAFKYELTGVLVHSGSVDSGHYYSFIKEENKWFKFDDSVISEFNLNDLKYECFGNDRDNESSTYTKSHSAYLLFYSKIAIKNESDCAINKTFNIPPILLNQIKEENTCFLKYKNYLDNDYFMFIREFLDFCILKNKTFEKLTKKEKSMSKKDLFNEELYNVINELFKNNDIRVPNINYADDESFKIAKEIYVQNENIVKEKFYLKTTEKGNKNIKKKLIKFAIYYFFEIMYRDKQKIISYSNFISELLHTDRNVQSWLLKKLIENKQIFVEYLLNNTSQEVRDAVSRLITDCIKNLYNDENKYLKETFNCIQMVKNSEDKEIFQLKQEYKSCLMRFFKNNILDTFDDIRYHWSRYMQYLQIIFDCFNFSFYEIIQLAIEKENLLLRAILLLMNNQKNYETKFITIGNKNVEASYNLIIEIICLIYLSSITKGVFELNKFSRYSTLQSMETIISLPEKWNMILEKEVFEKIFKKYSSDNTIKLIHHLCWGDISSSKAIINNLTTSIKDSMRDVISLTNLINNSIGCLEVDDQYKLLRIRLFFCLDDELELENDSGSVFNYLMSFRDDSTINTLICLKLIGNVIKKNQSAINYIINHNQKLVWIFYMLRDISSDSNRKDNLQIEATVENYNFVELFNFVNETYLEILKIRNAYNRFVGNNEMNQKSLEDLKENEMILDYNNELQNSNNTFNNKQNKFDNNPNF